MRIFFRFTAIISLLSASLLCHAQDSYFTRVDLPFSNGEIYNLEYVSPTAAWAVGRNVDSERAVILFSADNGDTWTIQDESFEGSLGGMYFHGSQMGYVCGQNWMDGYPALFKTVDGTTWTPQTLPQIHGSLDEVSFASETKGCTIGVDFDNNVKLLIFYTQDGTTWQLATYPDIHEVFGDRIIFYNDQLGLMSANSMGEVDTPYLLKTTDGGATWETVDHPVVNGSIDDIDFLSQDSILVCGSHENEEFVMLSTDGGLTWQFLEIIDETQPEFKGGPACRRIVYKEVIYQREYDQKGIPTRLFGWRMVASYNCPEGKKVQIEYFITELEAGEQPVQRITETKDAPEDATVSVAATGPPPQTPPEGKEVSPPVITVAGSESDGKPAIWTTNNHFKIVMNDLPEGFLEIFMLGTNTAILCVNERGELTVNGVSTGYKTSEIRAIQVWNEDQQNVNMDASCIDDENRGTIQNVFLVSGGGQGDHVLKGANSENISNQFKGWAGTINATGGPGDDKFWRENGLTAMKGRGGGGNDTWLDFSAGGSPVSAEAQNKTLAISDFTDEMGSDTIDFLEYGWPVKIDLDLQEVQQTISEEQILKLTGQFENFLGTAQDDTIYIDPLYVPRFIDGGGSNAGNVIYVDAKGEVPSDDGSAITIPGYEPITYEHFSEIIFENSAYTDPGDLLNLNAILHQNMPNPFRFRTTITYEVPAIQGVVDGKIALRVLNLQGQEVAVLVQEEKPPGTYQVEFRARDLAPGIYLYQLTVDRWTAHKKMVILE